MKIIFYIFLLVALSAFHVYSQENIIGDENWSERFALPGTNGEVRAVAVDGNTVYVGGKFTEAGGVPANNIAKWDGKNWSALGKGVNGAVHSLAVIRGQIYAGGAFTKAGDANISYLAKWNGANWLAVGNSLDNTVNVLAVQDTMLHAGGSFTKAGALNVNRIAKWDGRRWLTIGNGFNKQVRAIAIHGNEIYAGGEFTAIADGSRELNFIAKWDGNKWSNLGRIIDHYDYSPGVYAIAIFGGYVYAGGTFDGADASNATKLARWDGSQWLNVGGIASIDAPVYALTAVGNALYAGGEFSAAGGLLGMGFIGKWDGTSWARLGNGLVGWMGKVFAIAPGTYSVFFGGNFAHVGYGGLSLNHIGRWDGSRWNAVGNEIIGLNEAVHAAAYQDSALYLAGAFRGVNRLTAGYIAKWDGKKWSTLETGFDKPAFAIAKDGKNIYAGGYFTKAGTIEASRVAKWNGKNWEALGSGVNHSVYALAASGGELYAGGTFTQAGNLPANRIAKWNGTAWTTLGNGVNGKVSAILVRGNEVFAGGVFTAASGIAAQNIAKWDGQKWSALGSGVNGEVAVMAFFDDEIFAGGYFTAAGGVPVKYLAKWDGVRWWDVDSRMNGAVLNLAVNGGDLFAGGFFSEAGGIVADHIAKWQGGKWSALGSGLNDAVAGLAINGYDLYVGGSFTKAGNATASYYAKWRESNSSPLARSDHATTKEEDAVTINVLANDDDTDGKIDPKTLAIFRQPEHGRVEKNADNTVAYFPEKDFAGREVFQYTVSDLLGAVSNPASVRVNVVNINDAPVLDNSGNMILPAITKGESNPAGSAVALVIASAGGNRITDADSGAVEGIAVIDVDNANGAWQFANDSLAAWTNIAPVSNTAALLLNPKARLRFVPKPDFSGSAGKITFRAWDQTFGKNGDRNVNVSNNGGTTAFSANFETAALKVNVRPVAKDDSTITNEDTAAILFVTKNDIDQDGLIERQSVAITKMPDHGAIKSSNDSTWLYTPAPNFNGSDYFKYVVKDNDGALSNEARVNILLKPVNDAPSTFSRLLPRDNTVIQSDSLIFVWTRAKDVEGDSVQYTLQLIAPSLDTGFVVADTSRKIYFRSLKLGNKPATILWNVSASDGNLNAKPANGAGLFFLELKTGINDHFAGGIPTAFALRENYPNPFNPTTILPYELPQAAGVRVEIYDLLGKKIRTLLNEEKPAGFHQITWNGLDDSGTPVDSGVYLCRLQASSARRELFSATRKVMLIR